MATHSSILAWSILRDRRAWQATVHEVAKSQTQLSDFMFKFTFKWKKLIWEGYERYYSNYNNILEKAKLLRQ